MKKQSKTNDPNIAFLFKLFFYLVLGTMWLKIDRTNTLSIPVPIGFIFGVIFTTHEHFQIDRKIEYAVLLMAMLVGFILPYGLFIQI